MSLLARYIDDAYQACLATTVSCCLTPSTEDNKAQLSKDPERPMTTLYESQPRLIPPPIPQTQSPPYSRSSSHEWLIRTRTFASRASTKSSFSLKRKLNMYNPYYTSEVRRPHIGAPMDFRHVEIGREPKRKSFRPLELSIYMNANHLSPLMPAWESEGRTMSLGALDRPPLPVHMRSESAMSMFTIPRKAVADGSVHSAPLPGLHSLSTVYTTPESMNSGFSPTGPAITHPLRPRPILPESLSTQELISAFDCEKELPAVPRAARLRANTMPVLIEQMERVKSVMQERAELVAQLGALNDLIVEKQSLYMQSRPASLYPTLEGEPPLPPLQLRTTASKQTARPNTAPSRPTIHIPNRSKSFDEASSAFSSATSSPPPPPPLPLFLSKQVPITPPHPLRKKKSFSRDRVSSWLFPPKNEESSHQRIKSMSIDSITNTPRPITAKEGFYQCVQPERHRPSHHSRGGSESTVQTISTLDGPDGRSPTAATSFTSMGNLCSKDELSRTATFGQRLGRGVSKVGVAF